MDIKDQLDRNVIRTRTCWLWHGSLDRHGYGVVGYRGRQWKVHRLALLLLGVDLTDLEVDHLCRTRNCVRPEHLEPVTVAQNRLRKTGQRYSERRPHVLLKPGSVAAQRWARRSPQIPI